MPDSSSNAVCSSAAGADGAFAGRGGPLPRERPLAAARLGRRCRAGAARAWFPTAEAAREGGRCVRPPPSRHNVDEDRGAGGQVWFRSAEEAHRPDCRRTSPASTASRSGSPKPATRGSNAAALGRPTPTAGRRLDDQALAVLPRRAPRPGPAGRALPEHGPRGAPADGPGARAAGGPGDDQAARRGPRGSRPRRAATRSGRRGSRRTCRTGEPSSTPSRSPGTRRRRRRSSTTGWRTR